MSSVSGTLRQALAVRRRRGRLDLLRQNDITDVEVVIVSRSLPALPYGSDGDCYGL